MSKKQIRPGRFPLACLDTGPPPASHQDVYDRGSCDCPLCQEWMRRSACYAWSLDLSAGHPRSCMCNVCNEARTNGIALLVAENIRDLWSELSWAATQEGWRADWVVWAMEELADPARSPGWWASQLTHLSMSYWYRKWENWLALKRKT